MNPGEHGEHQLEQDLQQIADAYREIHREEPPGLLDQAVLNRARRAVEGKSVRPWNFGWIHAVTTTAVLVLALAVVMQLPQEAAAPPGAAPSPGAAPPLEAPATEAATEVRVTGEVRDAREATVDGLTVSGVAGDAENAATAPEGPARPAEPEKPGSFRQDIVPDAGRREGKAGQAPVPEEETPVPLTAEAVAASKRVADEAETRRILEAARNRANAESDALGKDKSASAEDLDEAMAPLEDAPASASIAFGQAVEEAPRDPETWLTRILEMKAAGEEEAAAAEFAAFRKAWPDYELPAGVAALFEEGRD